MENRKAAIEWFSMLKEKFVKTEYEGYLDMAIAALEFRGKYDRFLEEVKAAGMKGKETEIRHSGRVFRIREVAQ